jgi:hypothetical protein
MGMSLFGFSLGYKNRIAEIIIENMNFKSIQFSKYDYDGIGKQNDTHRNVIETKEILISRKIRNFASIINQFIQKVVKNLELHSKVNRNSLQVTLSEDKNVGVISERTVMYDYGVNSRVYIDKTVEVKQFQDQRNKAEEKFKRLKRVNQNMMLIQCNVEVELNEFNLNPSFN